MPRPSLSVTLSPLMTILHLLLRMIHSSYALQKSTILLIYFTDPICLPLTSRTPLLTMPNIFDSFCTTNGLYTHYDWSVIKLLNSSQVSCSHFDSFYADLLPTPAVPSCSSSCPVPAPVDLCLSQPYFTFSDFCDLLYFRCCICTDSEDLDDEIGQWCLGTYKHVDRKVKLVPGVGV